MAAHRAREWQSVVERNYALPPAHDRILKADDCPTPFCLIVKQIEGITKITSAETERYQLRISLYDNAHKRFFGRPWTGPLHSAKISGEKARITLSQNVYFLTAIKDINIVLVLEIIGVSKTQDKEKKISRGWTVLHLFASDDIMDLSSRRSEEKLQRLDVYAGTPRVLLQLEGPLEKNSSLVVISGCILSYSLVTHIELLKIQHLLPENVLVGAGDSVPGIIARHRPDKPINDIFKKPTTVQRVKAFIDNFSVILYPNIDKFEDELIRLLNEDRINRANTVADGLTVSITERRVVVGVHNGFCYVEKPEVAHLVPQELSQRRGTSLRKTHQRNASSTSLSEKKNSNLGTTYVLRDRVPLNGLVVDPVFTVVFVLEYIISEPVANTSSLTTVHMTKAQSFPVAIRWTAWSPYAKSVPKDPITLSFLGGPSASPDRVFVYQIPKLDMQSESAMKEMTGTISFTFADPQQAALPGNDTVNTAYQMQPSAYLADESLYNESILHSAGNVTSKPPRASPVTPRNELHKQYISNSAPGHGALAHMLSASRQPGVPMINIPQSVQGSPTNGGFVGLQLSHPLTASQMLHSSGQTVALPVLSAGPSPRAGGYPIEITHLTESSQGDITVGGDLQELPFTPVHAPIMAVPPGSKTGTGLTRAAYARLYSANFPPILDRTKHDAEVVNPDDYINFVMSREESDPLQCNEIILQFLAYSRISSLLPEGSSENISTVFFTFQFYKFPYITTERLLLGQPEQQISVDKMIHPCILKRLNPNGSVRDGPAGYQIKYIVDPTHMKPGEGSLFVRHLSQQTLHIDVWDGDSLILIGSCAVELKHLCRQGRSGVQATYELDVHSTEISETKGNAFTGDLSRSGSVRPVGVQTLLKGKLHLRLANIGHPVDPKYLPKNAKVQNPTTKAVIRVEKGDMLGSFIGGSLTSIQNVINVPRRAAKAHHLAYTNVELASLLHSKLIPDEGEKQVNNNSNSKLARMQAVRERIQNEANGAGDENRAIKTIMTYKKQKSERARDLKIMEAYREQTKSDGIKNMLNQAITTEFTIHPSMGTTEFFEYELINPNNCEVTVAIHSESDEISVITDAREWRHFKQIFKVDTPLEEGMFNGDTLKKDVEVFLRPKEKVFIPMKYLSFEANHACVPETAGVSEYNTSIRSSNAANLTKSLSTKVHNVRFLSVADNKLISILTLRVEPEPHVIDQTFRFLQPEQSFFKKSIRLPPFQNMITIGVDQPSYNQLVARCSDPHVICETYKRLSCEPQDIFLKTAVGMSPQQKKFFVCLYSDQFMSKPDQIWQFYIHALQRVDVSCVEGQTSRISLILRGTQSSRLVKCFTSHSGQMQVSPKEPFMLAAGAVHELHVGVRPLQSGTKFFYIHVVDVECHQLVRNWLVCVDCSPPVISKTFELQLPAGGGKGSNKRISYTNPYSHPKTFLLSNNRNDLLQFKESRLDLAAKETRIIGLRFMPALHTGSAEIMVYINDTDDKNEETFSIRVTYISESDED